MEALKAATINPAQLSRVDDRLGTVEKGKLADLIVVEGDPLANLDALHDLRLIMKGGKIVRSSLEGRPAPGFLPPVELLRGADRAHGRHDGDGLASATVRHRGRGLKPTATIARSLRDLDRVSRRERRLMPRWEHRASRRDATTVGGDFSPRP